PEFGLLNTSTAVARANVVNTLVFARIAAATAYPFNPSGTSLDFSGFQPLAGDPEGLVDALNALMMSGQLPPDLRSAVSTAVSATGHWFAYLSPAATTATICLSHSIRRGTRPMLRLATPRDWRLPKGVCFP